MRPGADVPPLIGMDAAGDALPVGMEEQVGGEAEAPSVAVLPEMEAPVLVGVE